MGIILCRDKAAAHVLYVTTKRVQRIKVFSKQFKHTTQQQFVRIGCLRANNSFVFDFDPPQKATHPNGLFVGFPGAFTRSNPKLRLLLL